MNTNYLCAGIPLSSVQPTFVMTFLSTTGTLAWVPTTYPWVRPTLDLSLDEVEEGVLVELNVVMDGAEAALVLMLGGEGGGSQVAVHRSVQEGLRLSRLQLPHVFQHWFPRLWHKKFDYSDCNEKGGKCSVNSITYPKMDLEESPRKSRFNFERRLKVVPGKENWNLRR